MGLATAGRRLVPRNALAAADQQDMGDAPAERPDRGTLPPNAFQALGFAVVAAAEQEPGKIEIG